MFVDFDKLTLAIDKLNDYYNKLNNNLINQKNNYQLLKDDNIWNGSAKLNEVLKYEEIVRAHEVALNNLHNEIVFLSSVKDNYESHEKSLLNKTEEL